MFGCSIAAIDTNFSPYFQRHIIAQAKEIARQCVEPPLRKRKPNEPPFQPSPSLEKSAIFLIDCIKRLPLEECQFCKIKCFPDDPEVPFTILYCSFMSDLTLFQVLEREENSLRHIERVYCGHLFHQDCLFTYMKQPPFGNKKCEKCGQRIHHPKWFLSDKLAEDRWAHKQAKERELAEVEDFLK